MAAVDDKKKSKKRKNETPEERAARKALKKQKLLQPKPRSDSFSKPAQLPAPDRADASETTFAAFAKEHAVELSGSEPVPVVDFAKSPFNAACKQKLAKEGFANSEKQRGIVSAAESEALARGGGGGGYRYATLQGEAFTYDS